MACCEGRAGSPSLGGWRGLCWVLFPSLLSSPCPTWSLGCSEGVELGPSKSAGRGETATSLSKPKPPGPSHISLRGRGCGENPALCMWNRLISRAGPGRVVYKVYQLWQAQLSMSDSYLSALSTVCIQKTEKTPRAPGLQEGDNGGSFSTEAPTAFPPRWTPARAAEGPRRIPASLQGHFCGTNRLLPREGASGVGAGPALGAAGQGTAGLQQPENEPG